MSEKLKRCPCGKTPKTLCCDETHAGTKWSYVYGDCCSAWEIEFRTDYKEFGSDEFKEIARDAWNLAPRASQ